MAKLHNYYVLCPLIDQKSFLGVSQDKEAENVLVTLGRNVVNKYRLSDQKQVGGWTSKDHITAPVIYDKDQSSYVGVFNNNIIKIWKEEDENLDKLKKYKFQINILKVIPRKDESSLVIFSNGNCVSLPFALENRKSYESKSLIKENDEVVDVACYYANNIANICFVHKHNKEGYKILTCSLREELGDMEKSKLNKVKVSRPEDVYVVGHLIATSEKLSVYILWSDTKLTVYDLDKKVWKTIGTVSWISTNSSVSMAWMGKNHLIFFGSNTDQDGAVIVAYNIVLGVGSCRYPMKMYSKDAKLYCLDSRIILEASNHIGMLPYVLETKRNLASLLGSHEVIQDDYTEVVDWDTPTKPMFEYSVEIEEFLKLGLTERNMCAQVIPPLLEKNDFRHILRVIKDFKDIPESVIVLLLNYAIKLINPENVDITDHEMFVKLCSSANDSEKESNLQKEKFELLYYLFQIPVCDAILIPHLRNSLNLDDALFLMSYISYLLVDSDRTIGIDGESRLYDWCTLLMDAFYQQYLMTKDDKVTFVLQTMQDIVSKLVDHLMAVDNLLPKLSQIISGEQPDDKSEDLLSYTIQLMEI